MRLLVILLLAWCLGTKDKHGDNNKIKEGPDRTYRTLNHTMGAGPNELFLYVPNALHLPIDLLSLGCLT